MVIFLYFIHLLWIKLGRVEVDASESKKSQVFTSQSIHAPTFIYEPKYWAVTELTSEIVNPRDWKAFLLQGCWTLLTGWEVQPSGLGSEWSHCSSGSRGANWREMSPGRQPGEVFQACPTGRRPWWRPRTHWRDHISHLTGSFHG